MNRRVFIGSLAALGTLAGPPNAQAQPARKVYRIGILGFAATTSDMIGPQPRRPSTIAFLRGMGEHHGPEPSGNRDDGQTTRATQGARPVCSAGSRPLDPRESE